VAAIIVAAGSSRRLPGSIPKQWRTLGDIPLAAHSFRFFDQLDVVNQIVIALDPESLETPERLAFLQSSHVKPVTFAQGGTHRQDTVWRALQALSPEPHIVLIHDAARPFPPEDAVLESISVAAQMGGAVLACPVVETIKRVDANRRICETIDRRPLWSAQTPQVFQFQPLMEAYRKAEPRLEEYTDDAGIFEANGGTVHVVAGSVHNFKVTTPEDFERAERYLKSTNDKAQNNPDIM
jgi:2-C-methyl-D-erythritol 4-phosphate cytidylyltransferase